VPQVLRAQLSRKTGGLADRVAVIVSTAERTDATVFREGLSYPRWRQRASYFFHQFFPSPAYMRTRYRLSNSALIPLYYFVRLGLGARRFIVSLGSILRNARTRQRGVRQAR